MAVVGIQHSVIQELIMWHYIFSKDKSPEL
jgi:hypothetical protein